MEILPLSLQGDILALEANIARDILDLTQIADGFDTPLLSDTVRADAIKTVRDGVVPLYDLPLKFGLLVRVGLGRYVIPLPTVEDFCDLRAADIPSTRRDLLSIRDELVPLVWLRDLFATPVPAAPDQKVVIVSMGEGRVCLVVDQVIGDHHTVIKTVTKLHSGLKVFSGATMLGDGSVALILDIEHLIEWAQE